MLPLIPALLLLLLQSPSNVERLAGQGLLPAALEAVHQSLDRQQLNPREREEVLARLLSAANDQGLDGVLAQFFALVGEPAVPATIPPKPRVPRSAKPFATPEALDDGIPRSHRTRDGPAQTA